MGVFGGFASLACVLGCFGIVFAVEFVLRALCVGVGIRCVKLFSVGVLVGVLVAVGLGLVLIKFGFIPLIWVCVVVWYIICVGMYFGFVCWWFVWFGWIVFGQYF